MTEEQINRLIKAVERMADSLEFIATEMEENLGSLASVTDSINTTIKDAAEAVIRECGGR